jgi:hypothetical protein
MAILMAWPRNLGLGKYEAAFRENDIDETVLPSLTHENLKELGVASLCARDPPRPVQHTQGVKCVSVQVANV